MFTYQSGDDELTVETEWVTVDGYETKPDSTWRFVDEAGHRHGYWNEDEPFPTLEKKTRPSFCCDECEDFDDPNGEESYYVCRNCSEEIAPRFKRVSTSKNVKTVERYTLKTVRTVTREEAEAWMNTRKVL